MSGRYLLDTSDLIAWFADERAVKEKLAQASEVFIPSIAVGDLYYGAWKSQRLQENVAQVVDCGDCFGTRFGYSNAGCALWRD